MDREGSFVFSGEECRDWFGHRAGENYTVAGNLLTGESVIEAAAGAYETGNHDDPLAERLIDALAAGHAEGGDKREELPIQSAALQVVTIEDRPMRPFYNDLRVDATETPIEDLRETHELAVRGCEDATAECEEAYAADDLEAADS